MVRRVKFFLTWNTTTLLSHIRYHSFVVLGQTVWPYVGKSIFLEEVDVWVPPLKSLADPLETRSWQTCLNVPNFDALGQTDNPPENFNPLSPFHGHSRSLEPSPIDRQCMTSYCCSIVTMGLSRIVSEINGDLCRKLQISHPAYLTPRWGSSRRNFVTAVALEKPSHALSRRWKSFMTLCAFVSM